MITANSSIMSTKDVEILFRTYFLLPARINNRLLGRMSRPLQILTSKGKYCYCVNIKTIKTAADNGLSDDLLVFKYLLLTGL